MHAETGVDNQVIMYTVHELSAVTHTYTSTHTHTEPGFRSLCQDHLG